VNTIAQVMLATEVFREYEQIGRKLEKWRYESAILMDGCVLDFGLRKIK